MRNQGRHHRRGTCDNNRTITREKIEARVLTGLQDRLVSSEAVAEAVRAYAEEINRLNHDRRAQAESDHRALQTTERAIAGIMAAIEDGMYQPSMKARMDELERQKAEIAERLAQAPADIPDVHPNVANIYRKNVVRFSEALDDAAGGREAAQALRSLIGEVVLTPGAKHGEVYAELRGELMGILDFVNSDKIRRSSCFMPAVAASPRNHIPETGGTKTLSVPLPPRPQISGRRVCASASIWIAATAQPRTVTSRQSAIALALQPTPSPGR